MVKQEVTQEEIREIVRLLSTDLDGRKKIKNSLRQIKGISFSMANAVCKKAGIDPNMLTGKLTDEQIKKLEEVIKNPIKFGIPAYLLNFRKHPKTGEDLHFVGADLEIETRQIIADMKKLGSYRGLRHRLGLPVRGQRTRTGFRKKGTVGVVKKKKK